MGNAFAFNLTGIAGISLMYNSSGYTYSTSPCGIPSSACIPAQHTTGWPYAAVTQIFPNSATAGNCYNAATGAEQPCTNNCEPSAVGLPQWQLINASNASEGLWGEFSGMFLTPKDSMACQWNPNTGTPMPRSGAVVLQCDPSASAGTVVVNGVSEVRCRTLNPRFSSAVASH